MFVFGGRNDASSIKALTMVLYLVVALTGCCKSLAWFLGPTQLPLTCFRFFVCTWGDFGNEASKQLFALVVSETQISKVYL